MISIQALDHGWRDILDRELVEMGIEGTVQDHSLLVGGLGIAVVREQHILVILHGCLQFGGAVLPQAYE